MATARPWLTTVGHECEEGVFVQLVIALPAQSGGFKSDSQVSCRRFNTVAKQETKCCLNKGYER